MQAQPSGDLVMVKYTVKGALPALYQGMGKDGVARVRRTVREKSSYHVIPGPLGPHLGP